MTELEAELLDVIAGLVQQHCRVEDGEVTSGFIGINATAIDILCEHGLMVDAQTSLPHLRPQTRGRWAKWRAST